MAISAVDAVNPALHHTKLQLFRPFRLGQWTKLALVGLLAGEMAGGGGGGGSNFHVPSSGGRTAPHFPGMPHIDLALIISIVVVLGIFFVAFWLVFLYVSSRMRFVLFDSVVAKNCSIREMWRARREPALRYFVWQLVFSALSFAAFALIVGPPFLAAFLLGWFSSPGQHIAGLILAGLGLFFVFVAALLAAGFVHVFTKDFVVPQMALEDITAFEGWRRLLQMVRADKSGYAGYFGMKVILAIAAAFATGIAAFFLILVLLIPVGGVGLISVLIAKAAGMVFSWNVFTITALVVACCVVFFLLFYGISLISAPVIVFFPAYSIYFFASRYPKLAELIYPASPPPPIEPPPIWPIEPAPEPAV